MDWALTASLVLNGFLVGMIYGAVKHASSTASPEPPTFDTVQGSVVQQGSDDAYEAERVGFRP